MSLQTQQFLRAHGLSALVDRFAVRATRHARFPNLVMLKYSQINSPMHEPVVQECRGLILDEAEDWRVVSFPYRKFFNYGEPNATAIDWATARVYEKLDGSLMTLYPYRGEWHVASSGTPDAGGPVNASALTFAELFWTTWKEAGYVLPPAPSRDDDASTCCFMFELMSPENRIVVNHQRRRIVLHGARDLRTIRELEPVSVAERFAWQSVRSLPLGSIEACLDACKALRPTECEGYVVCDAAFNRLKVKSPQYVALSLLKENLSPRRMLEIVRANESDEFFAYFPELRPAYDEMRARFDRVCAEINSTFGSLRAIEPQKDFAAAATKTPYPAVLFALRSGKARTPQEFFATATPTLLERLMGIGPDAPRDEER